MSYKLKVCVIDDEKDIRNALVDALNESSDMEVIGQAESVDEAYSLIIDTNPDALFLDIKLLEGDAFQLINLLKVNKIKIPPVILNTGFSDFEYAQRTFNHYKEHVIKILEKPFWSDWDKKQDDIIDAIIAHKSHKKNNDNSVKRIKFKSDYQTWFLDVNDLQYIEVPEELKASGKIEIVTQERSFVIKRSMNILMDQLPTKFIRISRYAIVNTEFISHYDHSDHSLYLNKINKAFAVGNAYYSNLEDWMESA